jgi:diacylglycerol kinase (ATP)
MRARLAAGTHLPHPGIHAAQGTEVRVRWARPVRLEVDGRLRGKAQTLEARIVPGALTLLP